MSRLDEREPDKSSQTVRALLALRELVLSGRLVAGQRISELSVVGRLGVSRTPVRSALSRLAAEGFLEELPSGGFAVKAFSERDAFEAIEIRGVLEGLGARFAAERGVEAAGLAPIKACLGAIDALLAAPALAADDFSEYVRLNETFHAQLAVLSDSPVLQRQIELATALPFASPSGFVLAQSVMPMARHILIVAQDQHRCIVEAIEGRESARAEAIAREHARLAARNLRHAMQQETPMRLVPGGALIRRAG